jgi:hypothetical protein
MWGASVYPPAVHQTLGAPGSINYQLPPVKCLKSRPVHFQSNTHFDLKGPTFEESIGSSISW